MKRFSPLSEAILLMLAGSACFALMNTFIRFLSPGIGSGQMVFMRNLCSLGIVIVWSACAQRGRPGFPTARLRSHFWRAFVGFGAMELWFYSVTLMPLTLATALSFTTPLFATVFAMLFLGEKAGVRRCSAIAIGFIGMLVILRPGSGVAGPDALYVLTSSALMAASAVLVKTLTRTEKPETIVFYMALFMIPWSALPALADWRPFTAHQLGLVFLVALASTAAHLFIARSYRRADMVVLMPFDFTRLVFTAALAYPFFGETVDMATLLGSAVIVGSAAYIAHRERTLRRRQSAESALAQP